MITKQDILDRATEWQLSPNVVEKDYVLGWLLAVISQHPIAGNLWVFKGGTSIKKCYLETYRFSEDLDFSLLPDAPYTQEEIMKTLGEIADELLRLSGIALQKDRTRVDPMHDKLNRPTFKGRVYYLGPLGQRNFPGINFDITNNEHVASTPPLRRPIIHSYPDNLPPTEGVLAYTPEELIAEKTRALFERTRPRDLYDVVYLLGNQPELFDLVKAREMFLKKCSAKNFAPPTSNDLLQAVRSSPELSTDWAQMLAHQLPVLPNLEAEMNRLPDLVRWLDETPTLSLTPPLSTFTSSERLENPVGMNFWNTDGLPLETVRFAGANRMMIQFTYNGGSTPGSTRTVEPYSLRRANTGNLLLYAWDQSRNDMRAFDVKKISNLQATNINFVPRYEVEFTPQGPLNIVAAKPRVLTTPTYRTPKPKTIRNTVFRPMSRSSFRPIKNFGPTYVYQCPYCSKKFNRKSMDSRLRDHKGAYGLNCSGRTGIYQGMKH